MPTMSKEAEGTRVPAIAFLLAACAGSADVFAFFGLGKAFASIVTGNLVTFGFGIATGNATLIKPTVAAVAGFIAGEIVWAWLLRLPQAALPLLLAELLILLAVLAAWLAAGAHPGRVLSLVLLAAVAVAMGGQSIWALRIHQTTTYFTGLLTSAISATSEGSRMRLRIGIRQFTAFMSGAIVSGVVLSHARMAAPALPVALLAMAAVVHMVRRKNPQDTDGGAAAPPR
jgi:uncharacterized membrane protein YoaK (UPF0700 family)